VPDHARHARQLRPRGLPRTEADAAPPPGLNAPPTDFSARWPPQWCTCAILRMPGSAGRHRQLGADGAEVLDGYGDAEEAHRDDADGHERDPRPAAVPDLLPAGGGEAHGVVDGGERQGDGRPEDEQEEEEG